MGGWWTILSRLSKLISKMNCKITLDSSKHQQSTFMFIFYNQLITCKDWRKMNVRRKSDVHFLFV